MEVFTDHDQTVFACHVFFICFIFIKNFIWTLAVRTSVPEFMKMSNQFHIQAIRTPTLLFFWEPQNPVSHCHHILSTIRPQFEVPFRGCSIHFYRCSAFPVQSVPVACIPHTACESPALGQDLPSGQSMH